MPTIPYSRPVSTEPVPSSTLDAVKRPLERICRRDDGALRALMSMLSDDALIALTAGAADEVVRRAAIQR